MISTIIGVGLAAYIAYIFATIAMLMIASVCEKDWVGVLGCFGYGLYYGAAIMFAISVWSFIIGYGLTFLTYHEVNIIKQGNIIGLITLVVCIISYILGKYIINIAEEKTFGKKEEKLISISHEEYEMFHNTIGGYTWHTMSIKDKNKIIKHYKKTGRIENI